MENYPVFLEWNLIYPRHRGVKSIPPGQFETSSQQTGIYIWVVITSTWVKEI